VLVACLISHKTLRIKGKNILNLYEYKNNDNEFALEALAPEIAEEFLPVPDYEDTYIGDTNSHTEGRRRLQFPVGTWSVCDRTLNGDP
jgi:hypothetical protein